MAIIFKSFREGAVGLIGWLDVVDARGYGKRFIVRADEILTAFVELQRAIHSFAVRLMSKI